MTEKDLKRLNRRQLLELLLEQTERNEKLQRQLAGTERRLRDRTLTESEAGSLAEASLKLNGIFEAADAAAKQYLENVKNHAGEYPLSSSDAEKKIALLEEKYEARIAEIEKACQLKIEEAEAAADEKIKKLSKVLRLMYAEKQLLESIFEDINIE